MVESIKTVLIIRDNLSSTEADNIIDEAKENLHERLMSGELPFDICAEWFGLEEDYLMELL